MYLFNSRFFHLKATGRRRNNFIASILVQDTEYTDQQNKEEHISQHFNDLGTYQPKNSSLNLEALDLSTCDLSSLDLAFSKEEIQKAIFNMHTDKAPSPDGYTPSSFAGVGILSNMTWLLLWDTFKGWTLKTYFCLSAQQKLGYPGPAAPRTWRWLPTKRTGGRSLPRTPPANPSYVQHRRPILLL